MANPTTGVGVATNVVLTGLGVVPIVPKIPGTRGVSQFAVTVPVGTSVQVTALPFDDAGNAVPEYPVSSVLTSTPVNTHLLTAGNYAVLAYSAVTGSAGAGSVVTGGNVGISPTALTGVTNFPPSSVVPPNIIEGPDAATVQAQVDLAAAIVYWGTTYPAGLGGTVVVAADNLSTGGNGATASTWTAGAYSGGSLNMPTSITLDAQGNPNAIFVFIAASTVSLNSGSSVLLANGAQAANVYWVVGSSFTSVWNGIQSNMVGNILAHTSVTLGGGNLNGRALANTGAVTMATTEIINVPTALPIVTTTAGASINQPNAITKASVRGVLPGFNIPAWYKPSNLGKSYSNVYMAPAVVDDNDSNPWTVRGRFAGQTIIDFQIPTFENTEGQSLIETSNVMDETYIDTIDAQLTVTVTGGTS